MRQPPSRPLPASGDALHLLSAHGAHGVLPRPRLPPTLRWMRRPSGDALHLLGAHGALPRRPRPRPLPEGGCLATCMSECMCDQVQANQLFLKHLVDRSGHCSEARGDAARRVDARILLTTRFGTLIQVRRWNRGCLGKVVGLHGHGCGANHAPPHPPTSTRTHRHDTHKQGDSSMVAWALLPPPTRESTFSELMNGQQLIIRVDSDTSV